MFNGKSELVCISNSRINFKLLSAAVIGEIREKK